MSNPIVFSPATLLAQLNAHANRNYTLADLTIGSVQVVDASVDDLSQPYKRNSAVDITAADGAKFRLHYNRLRLNPLFVDHLIYFVDAAQARATTHDLLSLLSDRIGYTLLPNDIDDTAISATLPATAVIQASAASYNYTGAASITLLPAAPPTPPPYETPNPNAIITNLNKPVTRRDGSFFITNLDTEMIK